MGVNKIKNKIQYLNYFFSLERDLETIFRYIEPDKKNFDTYSLENAKLFLLIGSEIDILFKEILGIKKGDIKIYRKAVIANPDYGEKFYKQKVSIEKYGITAESPWINFGQGKSPDWWTSYNNIKHDRFKHFNEANLTNLINALCGLFILVCFYISDDKGNLGIYYTESEGLHINESTVLCKIKQ